MKHLKLFENIENTVDTEYQRIIPRDLFNEAKLLKCMGRLCLLIHDDMTPVEMSFDEVDKFEIGQLKSDGALTIANMHVYIKGKEFLFKAQYNNKHNYPFKLEHDDADYQVFDENGNFDQEFLDFCKKLKPAKTRPK
jgi:hypothetical protein